MRNEKSKRICFQLHLISFHSRTTARVITSEHCAQSLDKSHIEELYKESIISSSCSKYHKIYVHHLNKKKHLFAKPQSYCSLNFRIKIY